MNGYGVSKLKITTMDDKMSNIEVGNENVILPEFTEISELNSWIFENIRPYFSGRNLEIGSGSSEFATLFIKNSIPVHLSNLNPDVCELLATQYKTVGLVRMIHNLDYNHPNFSLVYSDMFD